MDTDMEHEEEKSCEEFIRGTAAKVMGNQKNKEVNGGPVAKSGFLRGPSAVLGMVSPPCLVFDFKGLTSFTNISIANHLNFSRPWD